MNMDELLKQGNPLLTRPVGDFNEAPLALQRVFAKAGIKTWEDVASRDGLHVFNLMGIGRVSWAWLQREVARRSLAIGITGSEPNEGPNASGVYFVHGAGQIKIGMSDCFSHRVASLRASCPVLLNVLGVIYIRDLATRAKAERDLHQRFAQYHARCEWFWDSPAIRDYIKENASPWLGR